jgi:hypothetical protein
MEWDSDLLYEKAKLFAQRAHNEPVESSIFAFWMSISLEILARAALAQIHPVLLADPREQDNIHYAFGINPKGSPKSIPAKALFARCSVFVKGFTDKMSGHCLIVADRRNSELHSGIAAFENLDNWKWLPATYEVMEVLLAHLNSGFADFLADHEALAVETLKDRREGIKKDVQSKLAVARRLYNDLTTEERTRVNAAAQEANAALLKDNQLRRKTSCPACGQDAVIGGETVGRSPVRIDEEENAISREIRVMPNRIHCAHCQLTLTSFQELHEAERGNIYTVEVTEDPIEFFGIDPEEYVDVDEIVRRYGEDMAASYENE